MALRVSDERAIKGYIRKTMGEGSGSCERQLKLEYDGVRRCLCLTPPKGGCGRETIPLGNLICIVWELYTCKRAI